MQVEDVPAALRSRLGTDASRALLALLDRSHAETREDMIGAGTERFERRLVEEVSGVRVQLAQVESSLRGEMSDLRATVREEIGAVRVDLLRWSFLFWIGQALAVAGMLGVVLRTLR